MLHNPKWDHGTLPGLINWLESKPRDGQYQFFNCFNCLIRQYMTGKAYETWPAEMHKIYNGGDAQKIAIAHPQTYGAALERAYKARETVAA